MLALWYRGPQPLAIQLQDASSAARGSNFLGSDVLGFLEQPALAGFPVSAFRGVFSFAVSVFFCPILSRHFGSPSTVSALRGLYNNSICCWVPVPVLCAINLDYPTHDKDDKEAEKTTYYIGSTGATCSKKLLDISIGLGSLSRVI